jgi:hypothetical protein
LGVKWGQSSPKQRKYGMLGKMALLSSLVFLSRSGILSEKRLSGVAELRYVMVYGKSQSKLDASVISSE